MKFNYWPAMALLFLAVLPKLQAQDNRGFLAGQKRESVVINFPITRWAIDSSHLHNYDRLKSLDSILSYVLYDKNRVVDSLLIHVSGSPDGTYAFNHGLTNKRTTSIKNYIAKQYPELNDQGFVTTSVPENWIELREIVCLDDKFPVRAKALRVIDSCEDAEEREAELRRMDEGVVFEYMEQNVFPWLRYGRVSLVWHEGADVLALGLLSKESSICLEGNVMEPQDMAITDPGAATVCGVDLSYKDKVACPVVFGVKTNVAQLAVGVANLGVEVGFCGHYSLDLPVIYSPYKIKSDYMVKVIAFQPEVRYWIREGMQGHFFGLHGAVASFNVAVDSKTRYQDPRPMWQAGVSYGYALPFAKGWGAEFTIGAGYSNIAYDAYYNIANGAQFNTDTKHYWGITRLGINLVYKFNIK